MHTLAHFAFALFLCCWGFLCGVGAGADVKRWLKKRQKPAESRREGLWIVGGGHE